MSQLYEIRKTLHASSNRGQYHDFIELQKGDMVDTNPSKWRVLS